MKKSRLLTATLTVLAIIALVVPAHSQDSTEAGWATTLILDITTTQTAYSDSWTGGEAGSFNWVSNLNGSAERQLHDKMNLKSTLKMSFGQTLTQDKETKEWSKPTKSTDLIDWETVSRFTFHWAVDPYAAFRLESQFLDASVDEKDRYLNPMLLTESVGIARKFYDRDKNQILSRIGLAIRQKISKDIIDTLFNTETNTATDGGLESVTDVTWHFNERLNYTGKLTLFKAFYFSKKDDYAGTEAEDYWKAVDVNWENIVHASISKIITVNFYTQVLYDKQVSKKGRFKETLGIGFVFKLA